MLQFAYFQVCLRRKSTLQSHWLLIVTPIGPIQKIWNCHRVCTPHCLTHSFLYILRYHIKWVVCPIQSPPNPYCWWFNPHFRSMAPQYIPSIKTLGAHEIGWGSSGRGTGSSSSSYFVSLPRDSVVLFYVSQPVSRSSVVPGFQPGARVRLQGPFLDVRNFFWDDEPGWFCHGTTFVERWQLRRGGLWFHVSSLGEWFRSVWPISLYVEPQQR